MKKDNDKDKKRFKFMPMPSMEDLEQNFSRRTLESMKFVRENGVSTASHQTLLRVGNSLIREANRRIRELERAGYTDMPAYRYYKNEIKKFTLAKANNYQARHMVMEAYKFLLSKTSTVEGAKKFMTSTIEKWVGRDTSREMREKLFDLFNRLEKEHPAWFDRESYSSSELAADIYVFSEVLRQSDFDIDTAYNILNLQAGESFMSSELLSEEQNDMVSDWFTRKQNPS